MIYDALVLIAGIIASAIVLAIFMFPFIYEARINAKAKTIRKPLEKE